jgi:hypothetical protein
MADAIAFPIKGTHPKNHAAVVHAVALCVVPGRVRFTEPCSIDGSIL